MTGSDEIGETPLEATDVGPDGLELAVVSTAHPKPFHLADAVANLLQDPVDLVRLMRRHPTSSNDGAT